VAFLPQPQSTVLDATTDYREIDGNPQLTYSTAASQANLPRAVAVINGIRVPVTSYEISAGVHGAADTGTLTLGLAGNPDWAQSLDAALQDGSVIAEIYAGFPTTSQAPLDITGFSQRWLGLVQTFDPDFGGDEVEFKLISLGALLTVERRTTNSINQTTADFVTGVATQMSLVPNIQLSDGQTPATMAQVFQQQQMVGVRNLKLSDLLVKCAEVDDVDVWVSGNVLNYVASSKIGRQVCQLKYGQDILIKDCKGHHAPQFSKTIQVDVLVYQRKTRVSATTRVSTNPDGTATVTSSYRTTTTDPVYGTAGATTTTSTYNPQTGATTTSVNSSQSSGGAKSSGYTNFSGESAIERYKYRFNGLTQEEANQRAITIWNRLSRNEYGLDFTVAVTPSLLPYMNVTTLFQISQLPWPSFNNNPARPYYFPRRFTERFAVANEGGESEGWTVSFVAVSHRPPEGSV
jgi:hypothetical protein